MPSAVKTNDVTIISYKPLSDLNFAKYTHDYDMTVHALFFFGVYKLLIGSIVHQICGLIIPTFYIGDPNILYYIYWGLSIIMIIFFCVCAAPPT